MRTQPQLRFSLPRHTISSASSTLIVGRPGLAAAATLATSVGRAQSPDRGCGALHLALELSLPVPNSLSWSRAGGEPTVAVGHSSRLSCHEEAHTLNTGERRHREHDLGGGNRLVLTPEVFERVAAGLPRPRLCAPGRLQQDRLKKQGSPSLGRSPTLSSSPVTWPSLSVIVFDCPPAD